MDEHYDEYIKRKNFNEKMIIEYIILFIFIIISIHIYNNCDTYGILSSLLLYFNTFIACFINPIIIFGFYIKSGLRKSLTIKKRILYILLITLPILLVFLVIFSMLIVSEIYDYNYYRSSGDYKVKEANYKTPKEFYNELKKRNLLYNEDTYDIMNRLNGDHDCENYIRDGDEVITQKCYSKATMVGIDNETYYDSIKNRDITNMYKKSFPVYIYNAILTLPSGDEKLQYAALGRFSYNTYDYGNYRPEREDYYIECKILYVDGDIYAIIGIDDSIGSYFDNNKTYDRDYMHPYYMILSEKSSIKTYVRGRYHPKGAIEDYGSSFEMRANTLDVDSKYPIKKVSKLNKNTINKVANELQNGILKKSIEEYHKGDKEKK